MTPRESQSPKRVGQKTEKRDGPQIKSRECDLTSAGRALLTMPCDAQLQRPRPTPPPHARICAVGHRTLQQTRRHPPAVTDCPRPTLRCTARISRTATVAAPPATLILRAVAKHCRGSCIWLHRDSSRLNSLLRPSIRIVCTRNDTETLVAPPLRKRGVGGQARRLAIQEEDRLAPPLLESRTQKEPAPISACRPGLRARATRRHP